jgi:hypothetical protein
VCVFCTDLRPNSDFYPYTALTDWFCKPRWRVLTVRYGLSPCMKKTPFVIMRVCTGWGISRLTPIYPKVGSKMAAVAPMSRISCSFTPNHYILRARCIQDVRVNRLMPHSVFCAWKEPMKNGKEKLSALCMGYAWGGTLRCISEHFNRVNAMMFIEALRGIFTYGQGQCVGDWHPFL